MALSLSHTRSISLARSLFLSLSLSLSFSLSLSLSIMSGVMPCGGVRVDPRIRAGDGGDDALRG